MSHRAGKGHPLLSATLLFLGLLTRSSTASATQPVPSDFNGDGKTDIAVFHRAAGTPGLAYWKYLTSCEDTSEDSIQWGVSSDTPVPGDYDGSSATEPAIAHPGTSQLEWWVYPGTGVEAYFGQNADIPLPRDYVGNDGETEIATVRPGTGNLLWLVHNEGTGDYFTPRSWGLSSDKLVPEDYNGDGRADPAVFRPSDGYWYIQDWVNSSNWWSVQFGYSTDRPVPGDYDGDGEADLAVFRPSNGTWYVLQSSTDTDVQVQWGVSTDIPVPGDYDGDGKFDPAVFRPSTATWYILYSGSSGYCGKQFGEGTDTPVPALYTPYYQ
jgi:hypothetical protein